MSDTSDVTNPLDAWQAAYNDTGEGSPELLARIARGLHGERGIEVQLALFGMTDQEAYLWGAIQLSGGIPDNVSSFNVIELVLPLYDAALAGNPVRSRWRLALMQGAAQLRLSAALNPPDPDRLRTALAAMDDVVAERESNGPRTWRFLAARAGGRMTLARSTDDDSLLLQALRDYDEALQAPPADDAVRTDVLADAARLGIEVAVNTGARALGEPALARYLEVAERDPGRTPQLISELTECGAVLAEHDDRDALVLSIAVWRTAARLADGDPEITYLTNQFVLLERLGDDDRDTERLEVLDRLIALTDGDEPRHSESLFQAAVIHRRRFLDNRRREEALAAIEYFGLAAERGAPERRRQAIVGAGDCLLMLQDDSGSPADFDASEDHWRTALAATSPTDPDSADWLGGLVATLVLRAAALKDPASLDRAVDAVDAALASVDGLPISDAHRARLAELEHTVLDNRFYATRRPADLERLLELAKRAFEAATPEERTERANKYAEHLVHRFELGAAISDLDNAIAILEQARPDDATEPAVRVRWLELSGNAYLNRSQHWGISQVDNLNRARECFETALKLTKPGDPGRTPHLLGLATALTRTYKLMPVLDSVRELPAELLQQAFDEAPDDRQRGHAALMLGQELLARAQTSRRTSGDMDRAVTLLEAALAAAGEDPGLLDADVPLAGAYAERFRDSGDDRDRERAIAHYQAAVARLQERSLDGALAAATEWGLWAAERGAWVEADEAFRAALAAAGPIYRANTAVGASVWLRRTWRLAIEAAYAFARAERPLAAAVALEQSRFRAGSEVAAVVRADLAGLEQSSRGELVGRLRAAADRWRSVARFADDAPPAPAEVSMRLSFDDFLQLRAGVPLDPPASAAVPTGPGLGAWEQTSRDLQHARATFDAIVAEIREIDGFGHFLADASEEDVRQVGKAFPLIYLAAAQHGGVAIAVVPGRETAAVPLESLTHAAVAAEVERFRDAHADPARWEAQLDETTRWLWDAAMREVVALAGSADRLLLVPTGLLGVLPWHAAWRPDAAAPTGRRYACDDVAIAFAPNARSIDRHASLNGERLVAIVDPAPLPEGVPAITFAEPELASATAWTANATVLPGEQADKCAVLDALDEGTVCHFACHGRADLAHPRDSALLLARGETLTLDDLLALRLERRPEGRLALLTACETAIAGDELPDEIVSLPGALLQGAFTAVVATQWAVLGLPTAFVAARFYEHWKGDGLAPAKALARAQTWVRDSTDDEKAEWADPAVPDSRLPVAARRSLWREVAGGGRRRRFEDIADWGAFTYAGNPGWDRDDA